jgi:hypothetical protein
MIGRTPLIAAGLGGGLMYVFDPDRGRRRRALARDRTAHLLRKTGDAIGATARDMTNRTRGILAEARSAVRAEGDVPDQVVEERVRTELGHYCSHPASIDVSARPRTGRSRRRDSTRRSPPSDAGRRACPGRVGDREPARDPRTARPGTGPAGRHPSIRTAVRAHAVALVADGARARRRDGQRTARVGRDAP